MLTNCGQETRETRFTRRQDELSPGGVRGQMKSQLVLQAPLAATYTVKKKYLEDARLPAQETQLSVSKGSSHIHSSKHSYS